jgi:hypothetical protein
MHRYGPIGLAILPALRSHPIQVFLMVVMDRPEEDRMPDNGGELIWRAAKCGNGACVEVALGRGSVYVRDSEDPDGPRLAIATDDWQAFIDVLRSDPLD